MPPIAARFFFLNLLIFLALTSSPALAQEGFTFGLRLSPAMNFGRSFIQDEKVDSLQPGNNLSIGGGLNLNYGFTDNVGLQSGAIIHWRPIDPVDEVEDQSLNLTYLEIPLALKLISYDLGGGWYFKGRFGGELGFRLAANFDDGESQTQVTDETSLMNAGFVGGLGVEWDVYGAGYLDLGLSYHHGLSNVVDDGTSQFANTELKISYLALDIGFLFR